MTTTFDLVKIFFKERFLSGKNLINKKNKDGTMKKQSKLPGLILIGFVVILYGFLFVSTFSEMFALEKEILDNQNKVLYTIVGITNISAVFFVILSGNSLMFSKADASTLCTLPIEQRKIVGAKLIIALITDTFFDIYIGITGAIAYFITCRVTVVGAITILLCPVLSGILPLSIFTFIILGLKKAIAKSKFKRGFELIGLVFSILFIVLFSVMFSMTSSSYDIESAQAISYVYELVMTYFPLLYLVKLSLDLNSILYFVLYLLALLIIGLIFLAVFSKYGFKLMLNEENSSVGVKKKVVYKKNSIRKSLIKKEFGRMFSSNIYIMNSITVPILMVIIYIILSIVTGDTTLADNELKAIGLNISLKQIIALYIILMGVPTMLTPAFTLSLESKELWIPMTLPINTNDILLTKRILNYIIQGVTLLMIVVVDMIFNKIDILFTLSLIIFGIGLSMFSTPLYQILNLHNPALNLDDQAIIKQSKAVMYSSFIMIGFMIVVPIIMVVLFILFPYIYLILSVFGLIFGGIGYLLKEKIDKVGVSLLKNFS